MDAPAAEDVAAARPFSRGLIGALEGEVAETVVAAGGDVALVINRDGVICDIAFSNPDFAADGAADWLDRRWSDTVTVESRPKIDQMLKDAAGGSRPRWREINQVTRNRESLLVRFLALGAGRDGRVIAIGRDGREAMAAQQRLVEAQQAMERDYARLRDAEFRYRLLFRMSSEAVLVVDAATRRVSEANPAAERMIGRGAALNGEPFARLFAPESQEPAVSLLAVAASAARSSPLDGRLRAGGEEFFVSASLFRQDRASFLLVRLSPTSGAPAERGDGLAEVLERVPDPFIVADEFLRIVAANTAFLDLVRIPRAEQIEGHPVSRFIGRPGLDRNLLLETLKTHGSVRNMATVVRSDYDEAEEVEISGVAAPSGDTMRYGLTLRPVSRRLQGVGNGPPELRRSVAQLTELVGRVTLKELVRETTDLVEKLCIEAALELTRNNRASAAEVLGLSRQSLYSKLHRFGLAGPTDGEDA